MWAYCVVVAALCLIAVPVALAPVTASWGQHLSRRLVYTLACVGSTLLVLRAGASLVQVAYLAATGRFRALGIWEPWFYLGAVLFTLSTWRSRPGR